MPVTVTPSSVCVMEPPLAVASRLPFTDSAPNSKPLASTRVRLFASPDTVPKSLAAEPSITSFAAPSSTTEAAVICLAPSPDCSAPPFSVSVAASVSPPVCVSLPPISMAAFSSPILPPLCSAVPVTVREFSLATMVPSVCTSEPSLPLVSWPPSTVAWPVTSAAPTSPACWWRSPVTSGVSSLLSAPATSTLPVIDVVASISPPSWSTSPVMVAAETLPASTSSVPAVMSVAVTWPLLVSVLSVASMVVAPTVPATFESLFSVSVSAVMVPAAPCVRTPFSVMVSLSSPISPPFWVVVPVTSSESSLATIVPPFCSSSPSVPAVSVPAFNVVFPVTSSASTTLSSDCVSVPSSLAVVTWADPEASTSAVMEVVASTVPPVAFSVSASMVAASTSPLLVSVVPDASRSPTVTVPATLESLCSVSVSAVMVPFAPCVSAPFNVMVSPVAPIAPPVWVVVPVTVRLPSFADTWPALCTSAPSMVVAVVVPPSTFTVSAVMVPAVVVPRLVSVPVSSVIVEASSFPAVSTVAGPENIAAWVAWTLPLIVADVAVTSTLPSLAVTSPSVSAFASASDTFFAVAVTVAKSFAVFVNMISPNVAVSVAVPETSKPAPSLFCVMSPFAVVTVRSLAATYPNFTPSRPSTTVSPPFTVTGNSNAPPCAVSSTLPSVQLSTDPSLALVMLPPDVTVMSSPYTVPSFMSPAPYTSTMPAVSGVSPALKVTVPWKEFAAFVRMTSPSRVWTCTVVKGSFSWITVMAPTCDTFPDGVYADR